MGFVDLLPQEAEAEARGIAKVMAVFGRHGYERVRPPLLEFESSLLSGAGEALSEQSFRMLDPSSHRMMALRPDMTTQIARIAEVRLKDLPRPLRLSYSGDCVVIGTPGREGERQIAQAGIELIGPDSAQADAEVIALGAEALQAMGIEHISFDLSMPVLVWTLIDESFAGTVRDNLIHALDRRDAAAVAEQGGELADLFLGMMNAAGPAERALELLDTLTFPERLKGHVARLKETVRAVLRRVPEVHVTVDPIDFRGWRYHTGVCMTVFALHCREELGRGGRYRAGAEDACGLTLHPQALLRVAPPLSKTLRCMVPAGLSKKDLSSLHEAGYATVAALDDEADLKESARHLRCSHIWQDGVAVAL
ncbi:histidyl-tRNA synthetase [Saccharibacter floricola DSM 15669]|uniref:Histidyl-tRNA synthetase n=2 Tax=Saccharibacter TaxID=231052 RepID=A0ABQ0NZG5_9PROT|nr:histidyl-tRNA synthetase [Saccharibacter floricola DSM 15669]